MTDPNTPENEIEEASPEGDAPRRKRRRKRRSFEEEATLSINSLMDIVTIILVYLLKSYATSPIEVKDPSIELPTSTSKETVEEAAVVMVTGPYRRALDKSGQTVLVENTPMLVVDGRPLFELNKVAGADGLASFRVPKERKSPQEDTSFVVTDLRAELEKSRKTQEIAAEINEREFTGKVVILADKQTPYRVLMDLLVTCGQSGFGEFKFAIVKDDG